MIRNKILMIFNKEKNKKNVEANIRFSTRTSTTHLHIHTAVDSMLAWKCALMFCFGLVLVF